jgi:hypothetical protein
MLRAQKKPGNPGFVDAPEGTPSTALCAVKTSPAALSMKCAEIASVGETQIRSEYEQRGAYAPHRQVGIEVPLRLVFPCTRASRITWRTTRVGSRSGHTGLASNVGEYPRTSTTSGVTPRIAWKLDRRSERFLGALCPPHSGCHIRHLIALRHADHRGWRVGWTYRRADTRLTSD